MQLEDAHTYDTAARSCTGSAQNDPMSFLHAHPRNMSCRLERHGVVSGPPRALIRPENGDAGTTPCL